MKRAKRASYRDKLMQVSKYTCTYTCCPVLSRDRNENMTLVRITFQNMYVFSYAFRHARNPYQPIMPSILIRRIIYLFLYLFYFLECFFSLFSHTYIHIYIDIFDINRSFKNRRFELNFSSITLFYFILFRR